VTATISQCLLYFISLPIHCFSPPPSSLIKPIALATGRDPYFCGKPNPLMMRAAIQKLGVQREDSIIIGDRMDTDVLAGVQSGMLCFLLSQKMFLFYFLSVGMFSVRRRFFHFFICGHVFQFEEIFVDRMVNIF
jgi:hypothetical protein